MSFDDTDDLAERREAIQSAGAILIERLQKLVRRGCLLYTSDAADE